MGKIKHCREYFACPYLEFHIFGSDPGSCATPPEMANGCFLSFQVEQAFILITLAKVK